MTNSFTFRSVAKPPSAPEYSTYRRRELVTDALACEPCARTVAERGSGIGIVRLWTDHHDSMRRDLVEHASATCREPGAIDDEQVDRLLVADIGEGDIGDVGTRAPVEFSMQELGREAPHARVAHGNDETRCARAQDARTRCDGIPGSSGTHVAHLL
jgi:hypothetical protein